MRVAILDRESTEVGSANQFIEVPNLKKEGIVLSGIVLENVTKEYWARLTGNPNMVGVKSSYSHSLGEPDPKFSTAVRAFYRGTILRFGVELLNVRISDKRASDLRIQSRVFRDQQLVFQTVESPLNLAGLTARPELAHTDAIELRERLLPGDYVLQIIVADWSDPKKKRLATQYVQFEVLESTPQ